MRPELDSQPPGELGGLGEQTGKQSTGCICPPGTSGPCRGDLIQSETRQLKTEKWNKLSDNKEKTK